MKPEQIIFKRPLKVLQIFSRRMTYGKSQKSYDQRKEQLSWKSVHAVNGYISGGEIYLNETGFEKSDLEKGGLLLLKDETNITYGEEFSSSLECFPAAPSWQFYIFRMMDSADLHLNYNHFNIGMPSRDNFKLGTLIKDLPLEVKINGKLDFSMTGRRERKFIDQQYLLIYAGAFSSVKLLRPPFSPVKKSIPSPAKIIDLTRPMW